MNHVHALPPMRMTIWGYLFHASLLVILIWLILKVIGVIETPAWLEYGVPVGSALVTLFTFYCDFVDRMTDLRMNDVRIEAQVKHLDKDVELMKLDVGGLKTDMGIIKATLLKHNL